MNTKRTLKWGLVTAATACAFVAAMPGCELLVDFDRSKIPSEGGTEDGTMGDGPAVETGGETGPETSTDAPSEAGPGDAHEAGDAPAETTTTEGGPDSPAEAAPEAGPEGGDASDGAMGQAVFTIAPASVDYGTTETGLTTASYTFLVTNTGTVAGTPTITKGGTNPTEFNAIGCSSSVAPSGTCTLGVNFAPPSGVTGARSATISVDTGASTTVTGTAAAAATLAISPTSQDFGGVTVGSSSSEFPFTVTNNDSVNAVTLNTPTVDGTDGAMFVVDADGGAGQCSGTLAPTTSCTLFLHFTPTGTAGTLHIGSLSITAAATDGGSAPGTASASLTGTGN